MTLEHTFGREQTRGVDNLADIAQKLNRSTVYLSGLQKRFELPACEGVGYIGDRMPELLKSFTENCEGALFIQTSPSDGSFVHARRWFGRYSPLQGCASRAALATDKIPRRSTPRNFQTSSPGQAMGEDALRVLDECLKLEATIRNEVQAELGAVKAALNWVGKLPK